MLFRDFSKKTLNRIVIALIAIIMSSLLYTYLFAKTRTEKEGNNYEATSLSSNAVTCFATDHEGRVWIGTNSGLNIYNGYSFIQVFSDDNDSTTIPSNTIKTLFYDSKGNMWVGTDKGIALYMHNYHFKRFLLDSTANGVQQIIETHEGVLACNGNKIYIYRGGRFYTFAVVSKSDSSWFYEQYRIIADKNGGVWLFTPKFIKCFDKKGHVEKAFYCSYKKSNMCTIAQEGDKVWVSQSRVFSCVDLRQRKIIYMAKKQIPVLPSVMIPCRDGSIIMKSHKYGLFRFRPSTMEMEGMAKNDMPLNQDATLISAMMRTGDGTLYVGFRNKGFDIVSPEEINMRLLNRNNLCESTRDSNVTCLVRQGDSLWGYSNEHIFCYDIRSEKMSQWKQDKIFDDSPYFRQDMEEIMPLSGNRVFLLTNVRFAVCDVLNTQLVRKSMFNPGVLLGHSIVTDDTVFITASNNRMFCYSFRKDLYKTVHIDIGSYDNNTRLLKLNDRQLLMLCNNADVVVVDRKSLKYQKITVKKSTGLKNIITTCAIGDGHGVWIGTKNDGLLHLDMKDRILETIDMPIPEKDVMNLAYAGKDELCITTNSNVYLYNTKTLTCVTYKAYPDSRETINDNGLVSYGQGVMAVGTHNGCRLLKLGGKNARQSDIAINKLEITTNINNKIAPSKDIKNNEGVTLPYNDNDLHISFGECNYHHSIKPILSYKMDGYDDDWRHTVKYNFATYPNLPAGHYTFRVKSTLKNANGNYDECRLNITILPPVWLSWQALVLYFIAMMYIIYYINKLYLRNKSNELEINAKANEAERERRTNEMNIRFFANVSHEFRNPLTLIAGPVISLYRDEALPANAHNSLKIVSLSVNRMLQLIDQMLDFNKLENDVLKLQVSLEDVSELLRVNTEIFREAAACHSISVALSGIDNPRLMWVDKDKLIKIMDNLLTNALKHTDDGGEIKIDCSTSAGKHLVVTVTNNGKQIPEEKLPLVFKRYYQVKELNSNHEYGFGTGIGLYYVRQLVRLHHGEISVNNVVGGGVAFSFHLPLLDVYNEKEKLKDEMKRESHQGFIHIDRDEYGKCEEDNTEIFGDRRKMLVIDDDTNLSLYIRSIFKDSFSVKNLYSAEAAMEYLKDHQPDIIISDIVMDEMSGLELCRQLKQDIVYSHIPIILVSGKSNIREQIEGLKVGAIAYIVKPFDPDMLRALVESQMNNLDEVKKRLAESTNLTNVSDKLSPQDRAFMSELYALMEQQIAMEEMNISSVCEEMHVSRTKFNYKVKALTGMTPSNFFRIYKLNCAAKLLRDGKYNVSEAAMRTGFNNMPYFSTVFKKQFGVSPSEYK